MSEEPTLFPVSLVWTGGRTGKLSVEGKAVIRTGTSSSDPEEANYHSPEDLFVASASVCYMNGFVDFTRKMHIDFKAFTCDAVGTLEKVGRSFEITRIRIRARAQIESEELRDKIGRALELAKKYCFVGNSMKCPISHDVEIVVL
ncbi:MAG: hypothetical protein C4K48_12785 [Candidatus Thorarchaeota archaeon]|nr:MAG: hypothetical protein C4K48_12785 [Candidatus Thorarchaeota archaeon]